MLLCGQKDTFWHAYHMLFFWHVQFIIPETAFSYFISRFYILYTFMFFIFVSKSYPYLSISSKITEVS